MKNKVLVVDDDIDILEMMEVLLENEGYEVITADCGEKALELIESNIDLIILDVMMPGKSGYQVCRDIRKKFNIPILFLTARYQDDDLVKGFSYGGDDYLCKPFSTIELMARIKALIRRYRSYKNKIEIDNSKIVIGELEICNKTNQVLVSGNEITLTDTEYKILRIMANHRGKIFSAENLYNSVWEEPYTYTCNNTLMVHIRKLRKKIETDPKNPIYIKTVWGRGYRIE